jgi:hypothetical protein
MKLYPDVAGKFLEILSHEIRKRMGIFCSLPTNLFGKDFRSDLRLYQQHEDGIKTLASRDDLAALSGTAAETVSHTN